MNGCNNATEDPDSWVSQAGAVKGQTHMAEKLNPKQTVSFEELLNAEVITSQALIDLLVAKGIITEKELLDRIKVLKKELPELVK